MADKTKTVGSALVVGGGIGGIQASLDLADSGFKVYLLERNPSIGGAMAMLDKTLPTNDCSMCILSPKMVEVGNHPNVEILAYSELTGLTGKAGDFKAKILKKARFVDEAKCTGCGACAEACVSGKVDDAFNAGLSWHRAAYLPFPQAVPKLVLVDKDSCLMLSRGKCKQSCLEACQVGALDLEQKDTEIELNVGAVVLAAGFSSPNAGDLKELGYQYPDVLDAMEMERLQCASGPTGGEIRRVSDGEEPASIAWIQCAGSRSQKALPYCSGVCCAFSVKQAMIVKDHNPDIDCHIFFHDQRSFGKGYEAFFRRAEGEYGIVFHRFRQPMVREKAGKYMLAQERDGRVQPVPFDMVVLATGLGAPERMEALGQAGVEYDEYGFIKTGPFSPAATSVPGIYALGAVAGPRDIPETVARATAAAAQAQALLAGERNALTVKKEYPEEKDASGEPRIGVFVCHCGSNIAGTVDVEKVKQLSESLPGVVYAETNLYTCSAEGCEKIREAIVAHDLNRVVVAACTPRTHEPLFRETCREAGLNRYLFEMANIRDQCSWVHKDRAQATKKAADLVRMGVAKANLLKPLPMYEIPVTPSALVIGGGIAGLSAAEAIAAQGFEVHLVEREKNLGGNLLKLRTTLSGENPYDRAAGAVAKVGANSLVKVHTGTTVSAVSGYVGNFQVELDAGGKPSDIAVGSIVVATGGREWSPEGFLYGEDNRVMTSSELERQLADGKFKAKRVVMVQCVGSRCEERSYCSRVCCGLALKNALTIKEKQPDAEVVVLYRDLMAHGTKEDYFRQAREAGVVFLRYNPDQPPTVSKDGDGLQVQVASSDVGDTVEIPTDLVALSVAIVPAEGSKELSEILKVPLDAAGFFSEAHIKLRPVDFASDGIFLAGVAHSPKEISENIAQAQAAGGRAASILAKGVFAAEGAVARVDEEACRGCGVCVSVCPYGAISLAEKGEALVASVNPALCKSCGTCEGACLSTAITTEHFTNEQIFAAIAAKMEVA